MKTSNQQLPISNENLQNWQTKSPIFSTLRKVWQRLIASFIGNNELRIWQTYDHGNNWWHAYDPRTGRHTSVDSEAKMREWIEKRYS